MQDGESNVRASNLSRATGVHIHGEERSSSRVRFCDLYIFLGTDCGGGRWAVGGR